MSVGLLIVATTMLYITLDRHRDPDHNYITVYSGNTPKIVTHYHDNTPIKTYKAYHVNVRDDGLVILDHKTILVGTAAIEEP